MPHAASRIPATTLEPQRLDRCAPALPSPPPHLLPQLLASLDSPHIVRYFDSFLDPGTASLYICMEFCGGGRWGRAGTPASCGQACAARRPAPQGERHAL